MPNTREKLIELLMQANNLVTDAFVFGFGDISYQQQLEMEADHLIANGVVISNLETTTMQDSKVVEIDQFKWIPVTERLPDKDGKYLTYYHNHFGDITRVLWFAKDARKVNKYDFHRSWKKVWYEYDSEYGYFTIDDVTHWMYLPEPPKGE